MDPTQWHVPFAVVVAALFVIVMARANATYWLGRAAANGLHRTRVGRLMDSAGYQRAVQQINRWGAPAVSLSFLTVGVQTLINLAAGGTRMPLRRYLPAVTLGSLIWAFMYGTVGFVGVDALVRLYRVSPVLAISGTLALAAILAVYLLRQFRAVPGTNSTPEA